MREQHSATTRRLRRILTLSLVTALGAVHGSATLSGQLATGSVLGRVSQAHPDFSGTWILGNAVGLSPGAIEGLGNSPNGQLRVGPGVASLVISQSAGQL